jgi:hypothetical protein
MYDAKVKGGDRVVFSRSATGAGDFLAPAERRAS